MNLKKGLMIAFVAVILIGSLGLLIAIISSSQPAQNIKPPVSNTVSTPVVNNNNGENTGVLNPIDVNEYSFAVITEDDTIEMRNGLNDKIVIGLQRKIWSDINWSPDKKKISVLSELKSGHKDLHIYNTDTKQWIQASDYSTASNGIDSYFWLDSDTILFTQGEQPDHWLHRYKYSSGEILKLNKVNGKIVYSEIEKENIILQSNNNFSLYDIQGNLLIDLINIQDSTNSAIILNIETIVQSIDLNKFGILDKNGKFYKYSLDSAKGIEVKNASGVTPVCSLNEDAFIGYEYNDANNLLIISTVNTKQNLKKIVSEQLFADMNIENSEVKCVSNDRIIIKNNSTEGTRWLINLENDIIDLVQGKGMIDMDIN